MRRTTRRAWPALWLPALLLSTCLLDAQEGSLAQPTAASPGDATLTLRATVRRVIVDVVVTDNKGQPVPNLKLSDFAIEEDGKPQRALSFDAHGFDRTMEYTPAPLPAEPPNTFINLPTTPERGPLNVLLYDLVNTDQADQVFARKQLLRFINEKPEGARFAIFVFSDGLHLVQGFTSDRQQLLAAVDSSRSRRHVPMIFLEGDNYGRNDTRAAQEIFAAIGDYLNGFPGRKNLIWLSGGFPLSLFASEDQVASYQLKTRQMLDQLARDQIAVYPVDARGVVVDEAHAPPGASSSDGGGLTGDRRIARSAGSTSTSTPGSRATVTASSNAGAAASGAGYSLLSASYGVAREVAEITGGRAFLSNNDVHDALKMAVDEGTSYYSLSYSPTNREYSGKLRRIKVTLPEEKYHLAYRRAYYGSEPAQPVAVPAGLSAPGKARELRQAGDSLSAYMQHGAPIAHQLVFGAHLQALGAPAPATLEQMAELAEQPGLSGRQNRVEGHPSRRPVPIQTVQIHYAVVARQIVRAGDTSAPLLEVAVAAYDADGRILNCVVNQSAEPEESKPGAEPAKVLKIGQNIDVPAGAVSLRMAMRDKRTDRVGALEVPLPLAPETQASAGPGSQAQP